MRSEVTVLFTDDQPRFRQVTDLPSAILPESQKLKNKLKDSHESMIRHTWFLFSLLTRNIKPIFSISYSLREFTISKYLFLMYYSYIMFLMMMIHSNLDLSTKKVSWKWLEMEIRGCLEKKEASLQGPKTKTRTMTVKSKEEELRETVMYFELRRGKQGIQVGRHVLLDDGSKRSMWSEQSQ